MARARGANAQMCLAYESVYGTPPGSGFVKLPFSNEALGETQALIASDLLGFGRDPQDPVLDVVDNVGNITVPVDLRALGYWLKLLMGTPVTTQGVAATGSISFAVNPSNLDTITLNATVWTFVTGTPSGNQIKIGTALSDTIQNAVLALNASTETQTVKCSYTSDLSYSKIEITDKTIGVGGNSFTLAASAATASGATLAGGAATGPYNNVFTSGAATLPSASIEMGMTDVPSYGMNFGCVADTMEIKLERKGLLSAVMGMIAQGETRSSSSSAGTPSSTTLARFTQFSGLVTRNGVPLANLVSGSLKYANGLDKVEVIRSDGRIAGADPGEIAVTGDLTMRFADTTLLALAIANTPVALNFNWQLSSTEALSIVVPRVFLPKPQLPITGPAGIQAKFSFQASKDSGAGASCIATLINDIATY